MSPRNMGEIALVAARPVAAQEPQRFPQGKSPREPPECMKGRSLDRPSTHHSQARSLPGTVVTSRQAFCTSSLIDQERRPKAA